MLIVLLAVPVALALPVGLAWLFQRRLIYLPFPRALPAAAEVLPAARDVTLHTDDGHRLGAWLVAPSSTDRRIAVLVANGNGGNRSLRAPLAAALADHGLTVLLFDYRGYGGNPGRPTEDGLTRDVRAAHQFLTEQARTPPDRLIYFGESLGAAVVVELATERPPAGLVLRSPFVDLPSVAQVHYPVLPTRLLLRDRYPVADRLRALTVPTTVVYGTADSIVPPEQSITVARAAPRTARTVAVPDADHNDQVLLDGRAVIDAILDHAERIG
jgi:uncharacterized protein